MSGCVFGLLDASRRCGCGFAWYSVLCLVCCLIELLCSRFAVCAFRLLVGVYLFAVLVCTLVLLLWVCLRDCGLSWGVIFWFKIWVCGFGFGWFDWCCMIVVVVFGSLLVCFLYIVSLWVG